MAKKKLEVGDAFALPLPDGTYMFGRVLLDVYATTKRRLLPADSPLPGLGKAILIEMYREAASIPAFEPSEVLIPGAFVESEAVGEDWPVVAHVPVDVRDVRFPETLIGFMHEDGEVAFECGEIRLPIPLTLAEQEAIGVYKTRESSILWPYVCLHQLGRMDEIPSEHRQTCQLSGSDLRFTEHRARIYRNLPIDMHDCYYFQQSKLGLRLERLYE